MRKQALTTVLLLVAIVVMIGLLATEGGSYLNAAQNGADIITFEGDGHIGSRIILVDTEMKTICLYQTDDRGIRLLSARTYKHDLEIEDTSVNAREFWTDKGTVKYVKDFLKGKKK